MMFDPFCGCAITLITAKALQREWIGIDISPQVAELRRDRLQRKVAIYDDTVSTSSRAT